MYAPFRPEMIQAGAVKCFKAPNELLYTIIIIMEICKAPTLRLKALNKHTDIMYIEMENGIPPQNKTKREYISTSVQA